MGPFEVNVDERILEFTHFNLVIRVSKVKHSAIPFLSIFVECNSWPYFGSHLLIMWFNSVPL